MPDRLDRRGWWCALIVLSMLGAACQAPAGPERYRLQGSGSHWDRVGDDRVLDDVMPRYPEYFDVILDPNRTQLPDMRPLRDDIERVPVDRRNYDALNAIAIGYYETNYRAESHRDAGLAYLALSQRAAKLLGVPWRAYGETDEAPLRDAILDFFEDAGSGEKLLTRTTAPRLARVVASLEKKEPSPERAARIRDLAARLRALEQAPSAP